MIPAHEKFSHFARPDGHFIGAGSVADDVAQIHGDVERRSVRETGFKSFEVGVNIAQQQYAHGSPKQTADYRLDGQSSGEAPVFERQKRAPSSRAGIENWTPRPMTVGDFNQIWEGSGALGNPRIAARFEAASRRQRLQRWNCSFDRQERTRTVGFQIRHCVKQASGVRMRGRMKNIPLGPDFYQAARVHHGDAVCDLRHDRQIVRDKKHGQPKLRAKLREQFENLRLNRYIEGSRGLVGDQQLRTVYDRHRDHDPLPHASRKAGADNLFARFAASGIATSFIASTARCQASRFEIGSEQ